MITLMLGETPVRLDPSLLTALVAREMAAMLNTVPAAAPTLAQRAKERSARIAVKGAIAVYLDMIEVELIASHSSYPLPRWNRQQADYIAWGVQYIADYWARKIDGRQLDTTVSVDASGYTIRDIKPLAGMATALVGGTEAASAAAASPALAAS